MTMMRLYCPQLNQFVDPTDRNVFVWFQEHRVDPTIGIFRASIMYEATRNIGGGKYWDVQAHKIRYSKLRKAQVSGRYRLYEVPWSGMYDRDKRPIFHGDIIESTRIPRMLFVCNITEHKSPGFLFCAGTDVQAGVRYLSENSLIIGSAVISPHLVGDSIRKLFVYPNPEI
jgi:hypothetical protein